MAAQAMMEQAGSEPPAAAFGAADFAWEQSQEAAVRAFRARGNQAAAMHWRRGLAIARQHFERHDPRLGTSLTNVGFVQARLGERSPALRDFQEADEVFARGWRWVALMTPPNDPGGVYDGAISARFCQLIEAIAEITLDLRCTGELPVGLYERWRCEHPPRGCDLRKLMGAVLLIASRPPGRS